MARIRTIKPEFPQSETVGRLSRDARLLFIQLWTLTDDSGRARAASRMLASLLYPYDDDAPSLIEGWLVELEKNACIRRYEVDGTSYLEIINWLKHQKIDRPSQSHLPAYVESPREPSRALDALTLDLGPSIKGKKETPCVPPKGGRRKKPRTEIDPNWQPTEEGVAYAVKHGIPQHLIAKQVEKCRNHHIKKGNLFADWSAAWREWVTSEYQDAARPMNGVTHQSTFKEQKQQEWDNVRSKLQDSIARDKECEDNRQSVGSLFSASGGKRH